MAFEEIVKQVAETIQKEANARAVFADPIKLETHVVVPVATIHIGLGGGGTGGSRKPHSELARFFGAGGGGLDVQAKPIGFIHEKDGEVVFSPIEIPPVQKEKGLPERLMNAFGSKPAVAEKH
jgi:uncharacterized spore protein YtfJ